MLNATYDCMYFEDLIEEHAKSNEISYNPSSARLNSLMMNPRFIEQN